MKVFSVDVNIIGTAYIVAETKEEARELIANQLINTAAYLLEESSGGFVRGADFENLIKEIEDDNHDMRVTISPAITLVGPEEGYVLEEES